MGSAELFQEIVRETAALVKQSARGGKIEVSPEVAALLNAVQARAVGEETGGRPEARTTIGQTATSAGTKEEDSRPEARTTIGQTATSAGTKEEESRPEARTTIGQTATSAGTKEEESRPEARTTMGQTATSAGAKEEESRPEAPTTMGDAAGALAEVQAVVRGCTRCPLSETRTNTVFGSGNPRAEVVFIGEAPGADEDRQGLPFVGRAGELLTNMIVKGMKIPRENVYICNVLKCRPPGNREPNPEEVYHCEPYLLQQLDILRPKVLVALGGVAAHTLLKNTTPVGLLRGIWHDYHGIPLRVTYHPAYLLRYPADKGKAWEDIQEVMKRLGLPIEPRNPA
jgi:DNA polymerase